MPHAVFAVVVARRYVLPITSWVAKGCCLSSLTKVVAPTVSPVTTTVLAMPSTMANEPSSEVNTSLEETRTNNRILLWKKQIQEAGMNEGSME